MKRSDFDDRNIVIWHSLLMQEFLHLDIGTNRVNFAEIKQLCTFSGTLNIIQLQPVSYW
jgi:hypothetical protein